TELATAIWIGFDDQHKKLRGGYQYGGTACAPIWGRMMAAISKKVNGFDKNFVKPASIIQAELCTKSCELAGEVCPKKICDVNSKKMPKICSVHYPDAYERFDTFTGF